MQNKQFTGPESQPDGDFDTAQQGENRAQNEKFREFFTTPVDEIELTRELERRNWKKEKQRGPSLLARAGAMLSRRSNRDEEGELEDDESELMLHELPLSEADEPIDTPLQPNVVAPAAERRLPAEQEDHASRSAAAVHADAPRPGRIVFADTAPRTKAPTPAPAKQTETPNVWEKPAAQTAAQPVKAAAAPAAQEKSEKAAAEPAAEPQVKKAVQLQTRKAAELQTQKTNEPTAEEVLAELRAAEAENKTAAEAAPQAAPAVEGASQPVTTVSVQPMSKGPVPSVPTAQNAVPTRRAKREYQKPVSAAELTAVLDAVLGSNVKTAPHSAFFEPKETARPQAASAAPGGAQKAAAGPHDAAAEKAVRPAESLPSTQKAEAAGRAETTPDEKAGVCPVAPETKAAAHAAGAQVPTAPNAGNGAESAAGKAAEPAKQAADTTLDEAKSQTPPQAAGPATVAEKKGAPAQPAEKPASEKPLFNWDPEESLDLDRTGEISLLRDDATGEISLTLDAVQAALGRETAENAAEPPAKRAPAAAKSAFAKAAQPAPAPCPEEAQPDSAPQAAAMPSLLKEEEATGEIHFDFVPASEAGGQPKAADVTAPSQSGPKPEGPAGSGQAEAQRRHRARLLRLLGTTEDTEELEAVEGETAEIAAAEGDAPAAQKKLPFWKARAKAEAEEDDESEAESETVGDTDAPGEMQADPDDDELAENLKKTVARLGLRCALTGILAAALLLLGLSAQGVLPVLGALDAETAPAAFLGVNLLLLAAAMGISWTVLRDGLPGLVGKPSPDTLPALAAVAAALQLVALLVDQPSFDPAKTTLFAAGGALLLFADALGSRLMATVVRDNFDLVNSGVDHAVAYRLKEKELAATLAAGMEAEKPAILLSRRSARVKGFLAQSFSPRRSDKTAQLLARVLLAAAVVGGVIAFAKGGGAADALTVLAGGLCLGAPLSATLIGAVPSLLMQRAAARVGAVVPGWCGVRQLGGADMLCVEARDLFPPETARLYGIKTFQKERIDLAILYATSVLIAGCDTLEALFCGMIENKTEMLYEVKDLVRRPGQGFAAWCDNCRILLGSRSLMAAEGVELPAMDYENRYSKNGEYQVLYLAVSGRLYAMFLLGYAREKSVARGMRLLRRQNIRLLVSADDPTLTAERIEKIYRLEHGFVKVLSADERHALEPATVYQAEADGCMLHLGSFVSLAGGLRAACGAADGESGAAMVQTVSVALSVVLCIVLSLSGGLGGISLIAALLYQIAWSAVSVALPLIKKY